MAYALRHSPSSQNMLRIITVATLVLCFSTITAAEYQWAQPTYFASATCSEFKWVDDLKLTRDTVSLMENGFSALGGAKNQYFHWKNGTAEEFLTWTDQIPSDKQGILIFYFSTHQKPKGRIKFTSGPDLEAAPFISKINLLAYKFKQVLLIHDCCRGSELEKYGEFSTNVIRLYSASEGEDAIDLDFQKGPYGLSEFIQKEQLWIESLFSRKIKGLTFLTTFGLKSAFQSVKESPPEIDLQILLTQMNSARNQYKEDVRHGKVQNFKLFPENANLLFLKKTLSTSPLPPLKEE
jgi:hypothetical protein